MFKRTEYNQNLYDLNPSEHRRKNCVTPIEIKRDYNQPIPILKMSRYE